MSSPTDTALAKEVTALQQEQQDEFSAFADNKHKAPPVANGAEVATQEDAQEFVNLVKSQQSCRDEWQGELTELFRKEDEQDKEAKKLIREALINEAEYCGDSSFIRFRAQQEGKYGVAAASDVNSSSLLAADKENIEASMGGSAKMAASSLDQLSRDRVSAQTGGDTSGDTETRSTTSKPIFRTSQDTLRKWFENDDLLGLTPYAAVIPVPTSFLTSSAVVAPGNNTLETTTQCLIEEVDSCMGSGGSTCCADSSEKQVNTHPIVFEACPLVLGSSSRVGQHPFSMYATTTPYYKDGKELVERIIVESRLASLTHHETTTCQMKALNDTPCLFLNDTPTFIQQCGGTSDGKEGCFAAGDAPAFYQFFGMCLIARGSLMAVELYSDGFADDRAASTSPASSPTPPTPAGGAATRLNMPREQHAAFEASYLSFIAQMKSHVSETITPSLNCNNYLAGFRGCSTNTKITPAATHQNSSAATPASSSCFLLNLCHLEPQEYHLFCWKELQEMIQHVAGVERRRNVGLVGSSGDGGVQPIIKMAPLQNQLAKRTAIATSSSSSTRDVEVTEGSEVLPEEELEGGGGPSPLIRGTGGTSEGGSTAPSPDPTEPFASKAPNQKEKSRSPTSSTATSGSGLAFAFGSAVMASVVTGMVVFRLSKKN